MSAANAVTGQTSNSISPSLMPSSSLGSFDSQVFVVSSEFDVPSPMAAWAAETNPDDFVILGCARILSARMAQSLYSLAPWIPAWCGLLE